MLKSANASPSTLWGAFAGVASHRPAAAALVFGDEIVTFDDLLRDAERCAAYLVGRGLKRGDVVALQLSKRRDAYAMWLACLRQGFIYCFMDPRNPPTRSEMMLARLRPALLATVADEKNPHGISLRLPVHESRQWLSTLPVAEPPEPARTHALSPAYVMFTSGSTGEPKGAVIPQLGVMGLMRWTRTLLGDSAQHCFSNLNPLHFDNSVFDLYCGLLNGSAIVPVEAGSLPNPVDWVKALRKGHASVVFAVPTLFLALDKLKLLTPESLPDVKMFLFGGEGFPTSSLRSIHDRFNGAARFVNVYGPTETSCICSSLEIGTPELDFAGSGFVSLGRMHDGFEHAILDDRELPVSPGDVGELWLGGQGVGLGYFANPAETSARFRQDPRQSDFRSVWYRSGDLVREDATGLLWFHGRIDNQVKIRGHRVELEEIDLAVERVTGVGRAVCVAMGEGLNALGVAFTGEPGVDVQKIRSTCADILPSYMQPATIVQVDSLPVNANGKVDRPAVRRVLEALPDLKRAAAYRDAP